MEIKTEDLEETDQCIIKVEHGSDTGNLELSVEEETTAAGQPSHDDIMDESQREELSFVEEAAGDMEAVSQGNVVSVIVWML